MAGSGMMGCALSEPRADHPDWGRRGLVGLRDDAGHETKVK
jgi:hypothetical protein